MDTLKTYEEYINENKYNNSKNDLNIFDLTFESESGDITVNLNEGFVKDLQAHIRKTVDILIDDFGFKANRIDKHLEKNLATLTSSFQKGESPEETAKKIA